MIEETRRPSGALVTSDINSGYYNPPTPYSYPRSATILPGDTILFDGAKHSYDPDGGGGLRGIIEFSWQFSDDSSTYTETPSSYPDGTWDGKVNHTFSNWGDYTVTLTVKDEESETDTDVSSIKVKAVDLVLDGMAITTASLSWTTYISSSEFLSYEVHKSENGNFTPDSSTLIDTITDYNTNTYTVTSLFPDTWHYFKLKVNLAPSGDWQKIRQIRGHNTNCLDR